MTESLTTNLTNDKGPIVPDGDGRQEVPRGRSKPSRPLVFGIVSMALFMASIDVSIVATALPAIHKSLRASINWAGWSITIYSLGMVVALPVAGKISSRFGRRRIFLCGIAVFTVASLLCGFATDIYMLIVFRAIQALGGGALQPSAAGIIADHFGKDRDRAIGMFGTIAAGGQLVGPVVGGLLVGYLSWRWVFFVNVPIGIIVFGLTTKFIPESRLISNAKTDIRGLLLMVSFILAAIFGITSLGNSNTSVYDPTVLVPALGACCLLFFFLRHTRRDPSPFIPMRLLFERGFAVMNVQNLLWGLAGFGVTTLVPLYAEQRYGLPALNAGTLLTARAVGMLAVGTIAVFALRRTGYRLPMIVGFFLVASGTLLISIAPRWGMSSYAWLSISAGLTGLGNGMANPASRNACLQLAPDEVAALSGLRQMFSYIGVIFSVSIVTAILNRSTTPGIAQAHIMWVVVGIVMLVMVPLVFRVPEHKGNW